MAIHRSMAVRFMAIYLCFVFAFFCEETCQWNGFSLTLEVSLVFPQMKISMDVMFY